MAIKYLAGERLQGTAAERAALTVLVSGWTLDNDATIANGKISVTGAGESHKSFSMGDPASFVWDFDFYRGNGDTSGTNNSSNNIVQLSSNTTGYQDPSVTGDKLCMVYQASNAVIISFRNKPSGSFEELNTSIGAVQGTDTTKYFRMVLHSSNNTATVSRYPTPEDRTAGTNSEISGTTGTISSNWFSGTDLLYLLIDGHSSGTHNFGVSSVKLWLGTETASGTKTIDETFTNTYPYLSNGAIFEESDTGKHYMFDGTDTWNETK